MEGAEQDNNGSKVKSSSCNDSNMVKTLKLESFDLNDSHRDSQSFSQLLRNVLSRNSPCSAIKAKHQMPPKTPEVVKPEVAEKLELNSECAKPCASLVSVTPSAIFEPCSAPAVASTVDNYTPLEVAGTPGMDGYSWRKYGQKQLKNTNTYRSYYRCTHSGCVAKKKVQQFEQSGDVINIVHIGDHNHGPPQRSCSSRSRWLTSSAKISVAKHAEVPLLQKVDRFNINNTNVQQSSHNMQRSKELYTRSPSGDTGRVKSGEETGEVLDSKRLCLTNGGSPKSSSCWISNPEVQEKHDAEHSPEMRKEDSNKSHLDSISKATKKHKTVVPDAKNSPDGYRWRKYGQKFVKGNSHTRSYYRCKLAGCPARKQVEKAVNDATEIAITYEWEHNHDVHADHSCVIVSSTAPMIRANIKNTESLTTQDPLTNWSAERKQESSGAKVLKNGVVKDNISGTKNVEVSSVRKTDSSDMNSADVRQSSEHKSGSEPQSSNVSDCDIRKVEVEDQHIYTPESKQVSCSNARGSQQSSSGWVAKTKMQEKNDTELEPSPKKRKEESKNGRSDLKATKKHKIDVQDAAETRISHDRCRWRKYGQKLVKGNSHVRSYYRCTSTGCPARKHVETAVNDATATTETFEGEHKHDVPVIRKQCVPPTTFVNTGCAEKTETLTNASCLTKQQEDREGDLLGERVMELGGEKALESAQTLLSIKVDVRQ